MVLCRGLPGQECAVTVPASSCHSWPDEAPLPQPHGCHLLQPAQGVPMSPPRRGTSAQSCSQQGSTDRVKVAHASPSVR